MVSNPIPDFFGTSRDSTYSMSRHNCAGTCPGTCPGTLSRHRQRVKETPQFAVTSIVLTIAKPLHRERMRWPPARQSDCNQGDARRIRGMRGRSHPRALRTSMLRDQRPSWLSSPRFPRALPRPLPMRTIIWESQPHDPPRLAVSSIVSTQGELHRQLRRRRCERRQSGRVCV